MELITSTVLTTSQKQEALDIWNDEYPVKLRLPDMQSFDNFLDTLVNPVYYLFLENEHITGWAASFSVEIARCFFIMISGKAQGKGFGTLLLDKLKEESIQLFAWAIDHGNDVKADGTPYRSPINFYKKNGFLINKSFRLETEQLSAVNIVWDPEKTTE